MEYLLSSLLLAGEGKFAPNQFGEGRSQL